jgi:hypothetical protein
LRNFWAAFNLPKAELHRLLIEGGYFTHTPAQVYGLEAASHRIRKRWKMRYCRMLRLAKKSLKVELTKMRNMRED